MIVIDVSLIIAIICDVNESQTNLSYNAWPSACLFIVAIHIGWTIIAAYVLAIPGGCDHYIYFILVSVYMGQQIVDIS